MKNGGCNKIPEATIQRLPVYLYRLQALHAQGVRKVSSRNLSEELRISSSRLRHDFNYFGSFSRPGQPYSVDLLIERLREILALSEPVDFVIVGLGNLGQAIAAYTQFERDGFRLAGLFDINPKITGMHLRGVPVQHLGELPAMIRSKRIPLGIITVPPEAAQSVADLMVYAGIRGIWNFAPVNLRVPDKVVVHDEFLSVGIMSLTYKMKQALQNNGTNSGAGD